MAQPESAARVIPIIGAQTHLDAADLRTSGSQSILRRLLSEPLGLISSVFFVLVALAGLFAPILAPFNPNKPDIRHPMAKPGGAHLLGTDAAGRDLFSRLLFGTRTSLAAAGLALLIAAVLGITFGLFAGYFGGKRDAFSNWVASLIMALPGVVVILAARIALGPSVWTAMAILGVLMSPGVFRLTYLAARGVRNELYVDAAKVTGLSDLRIIGRHVLSVVRSPIIVQMGMIATIAVQVQAGLQIIGIGDINTPTWGGLISEGFSKIYAQPTMLLFPALTLSLTALSLVLFANALRDELDRPAKRVKQSAHTKQADDAIAALAADGVTTIRHETGPIAGAPLLTITDLTIGYPSGHGEFKTVVKQASLTVHRGEVLGLIGESGSGKTQTAFAVLGLLPTGGQVLGGSILFDGVELAGTDGAKQQQAIRGHRISYIPQEPMSNLDPSFTLGHQLVEPMVACLGISKSDAKAKALALLARVGIPDPARTFAAYPHQISGGMAQRVLIAGAVSCNPDLIIADEPTTALDVTVQAEVLDLLRELQRETHTALLLVTHNFGVVADLADRVCVMQQGRIVEEGPVRAIFSSPEHPYTRSLLDAILDGGPARSAYAAPSLAGSDR
jgi:peptide/nickel transport system permease protein